MPSGSPGFKSSVPAILIMASVGLPGPLRASEIPVVPTKLIVLDKLTAATKAKTVFVAKHFRVSKGTGTDVAQIGIEFDVAYANGAAAGSFTLPPGASNGTDGWLVNKDTVAKYVNKAAPNGPTDAKVGVIKPGKLLKLVAKSLGDVPLDIFTAGDPGEPGVLAAFCVTNAGEEVCNCSRFTGCVYKLIAGETGAKLVCKSGTGDVSCLKGCEDGDGRCPVGCETGDDDDCSSCFTDLGQTIHDTCNNLEWEKKDGSDGVDDPSNLHDVDNVYVWAGECSLDNSVLCQPDAAAAATCAAQTGGAPGCAQCGAGEGTCDVDRGNRGAITTIWAWLNQVNAATFAGHSDWRVPTTAGNGLFPTGDAAEVESLTDLTALGCGTGSPCIQWVFQPTGGAYWTGSWSPTGLNPGPFPWFISLTQTFVGSANFSIVPQPVRAVR